MNYYAENNISFVFIIDYELKSPLIFKLSEANNSDIKYCNNNIAIKYNIDGFKNYNQNNYNNKQKTIKNYKNISIKKFPINFETYNNSFKLVIDEQKKGNSFLLNLTFKTPIEINYLSLEDIFYLSTAKYKLYFIKNGYEFVVFSPETFINIDEKNRIFTYPVKGTTDAKLQNSKKNLLHNSKELAEHLTVVDLLRNDLNIVSSEVKVNKFRYIETIRTNAGPLLQMVSEIEGKLKDSYFKKLGDIFLKLLPAGSISGAPKRKTLEIIKQAELEPRGYYTGVFGYYDGIKNCLKSSVMIRFIENKDNKLYYRSGGGITIYSDALKEYNEMIEKIYVPIY
ncbi:MAG: aminodeoxychorismate synthase component I [bacterium]